MPDFDKDLNPSTVSESPSDLSPSTNVRAVSDFINPRTATSDLSHSHSVFDLISKYTSESDPNLAGTFVTSSELAANKRYETYNPTISSQEDFAAYGQSEFDKLKNGVLKGVNLAATTVVGTFATLGGAIAALGTGKLSTIWDNPVMQGLDKWNNYVDQELLPNYYTDIEKNAKWYSTDNWLTTNFLADQFIKNAGFAIGAMYSGNIANAAILGTFGKLGSITARGAATLAESNSAFSKVFTPLLKASARAMSVSENAKAYEILAKGVSNLAEVEEATAGLAKSALSFNKINDYARRTAISTLSTQSEAAFEALQTGNKIRETLINEYKADHSGVEPTGDDLAKIEGTVADAGNTSFLANLAVLAFTENLQLPYQLGSSYKNSRSTAIAMFGEAGDVAKDATGKWIAKGGPTSKLGRYASNIYRGAGYVFDPKEMAQEGLQYVTGEGVNNYFNKAYHTKDADAWVDGVVNGFEQLSSKEGMVSMILGGLSGGLMQARGKYAEASEEEKSTVSFLEKLNNAPEFKNALKDRINSTNRAIILNELHQKHILSGNELEARDTQADQMHNYLMPRIKYGRFDLLMDDLDDLRKMSSTPQGLASLKEQGIGNVNDDIFAFQERLNNFEKVAKNTETIYNASYMALGGITQIDKDGNVILNKEGKPIKKYEQGSIEAIAYAQSKIADYDVRINKVSAELSGEGILVGEALDKVVNTNKNRKTATKESLETINSIDEMIDNIDTTQLVKDNLKNKLSDSIEMTVRRKNYIDDVKGIMNDPEQYEIPNEIEDSEVVKVKQISPELTKAGNPRTVSKELEIGKEYSLTQPIRREGNSLSLAPKLTVLSKTLGGEYEVKLPNGQVSFMTPQEFKDYEISDEDNTSDEIANILENAINTIARRAKYKGLGISKAENKLDFINSLNNPELINDIQEVFDNKASEFLREQALEQAKKKTIINNAVELEELQDELDLEVGDLFTENDSDNSTTWEDMKKMFSRLFTSTTTASAARERENGRDLAPHIVRYNQFINNFKNFKNKANIRTVLVTAKQQVALGLTNLAETSLPEDQRANMHNVNEGFVGAVFVEQENGNLYPIDKSGKRITDINGNNIVLGKPNAGIDINKVVFSTMPKADLYYNKALKNGKPNPRYREGEKEQAENQLALWKKYREGLFSIDYKIGDPIAFFNFGISRGIAIKTDKTQNTPASVIFGTDVTPITAANIITTNKGLITVSTLGSIAHADGNNYKFAKGRPVLKYDDVLEFLNNSTFSKSQAKAIFNVIKMLSDTITSDIASNKKLQLKNKYTQFLQNVLYFSKKGAQSANKVSIDYATATITIGDQKFDFGNIAKDESRMVEHLQTIYSNVNNPTLTKNFNEPFYEFLEDGTERKWTNYQSYLLSSTTPDGKARTDIPLTVNLSAPTQAVPYAYEQKYAFLTDLKFAEAEPKEAAPTATTEGVEYTPEGTFNTDGSKVNRIPLNNGEFEFTYNANEAAPVKFTTVANEAIFNYIDKKLSDEKNNPNQTGRFTPLSEDQRVAQALGDFAAVITNKVQKSLEQPSPIVEAATQAAKTAVVPEVAPVSPEPIVEEKKPTKGKKRNVSANSGEFENFRRVGATEGSKITDADIEEFKKWHAKNASGIPYEILENIIKTHDNKQAWGVFEDGVAKFFKGAVRGTEYHEVFEGIFKGFLTESQQRALLDEFKSKKGEFTDRATDKKIKYVDATDLEAKERIADDFSDFRLGKLPSKSLSDKIANFFKAIMDFFKGFVTKPSLKDKLFKDINTGKFADRKFPLAKVNDSPEYRLVEGLSSQEVYEFTEDIIAKFIYITTSNNKSLFDISGKSYTGFFTQVIDKYKKNPDNDDINDDQYKLLVLSAKDKLKSLGFGFDEENLVTINDENANSKLYAAEAFTTDFKKSSPYAVKLLSASLPKTRGAASADGLTLPALEYSPTIGGQQLVPYNQVYATLLEKLQGVIGVDKMINKLYELAKANTDYVRLFIRLGGDMNTGIIDMSKFNANQHRLLIQFMQTYTKVKPGMYIQYVGDGDVYIGEPNLSTAAKQIEDSWTNNIIINADREGSPIIYNPGGREYIIKEGEYKVDSIENKITFLNSLGVSFSLSTYNKLKTNEDKKIFGDSIEGLRADLVTTNKGVVTLKRGKAKTIGTRLTTLAGLYAKVEMPNLANTFYNSEGKMQQTSTDSNAPSLLESTFNSVDTLDELKEIMPQILDVFSINSQTFKLGGKFFDTEGKRIKSNPLQVRVVLGEINSDEDDGESMSKLNIGGRYTTEINQNIKGNYYILIPADGATEWMMNLGNNVAFSQFISGRGVEEVTKIYRGYLLDDIALAQDAENRSNISNVKDQATKLRFFGEMLSSDLLAKVNSLVESNATPDQVTAFFAESFEEGSEETNGQKIDNAVIEFIQNMRNVTIDNLKEAKEISENLDGTFMYESLDSTFAEDNALDKNKLTKDELDTVIDFVNSNYTINNIEYHKILFGDPLQFKVEGSKLEETKRIKSFLSPRRITIDYPELNNWLNDEYNHVRGIQLTENDPGYHVHKSFARTFTAEDVNIVGGLGSVKPAYLKTNEADAASWISPTSYKEVKIKNGQWPQEAEAFHQWQMAYTRQKLAAKGKYVYKNNQLDKHDGALIAKPMPKYVIEILKSVVSGVQNSVGNNMTMVVDKFSQMPIYYQAIEDTTLESLFLKMFKEKYDYVVVQSGRKVGVTKSHPLYKTNGEFNDDVFNNTINVPWKSYGIQVENSYNNPKDQTMGSQLTKVGTIDIYENGKGRVAGAEKAYIKHKDALEKLYKNGYKILLSDLGITDDGNSFSVDNNKVSAILRNEMLRREMSNNAIASVIIDPISGQFIAPIEASTNYVQIRDILYAMVTSRISSPKMSGFSAVQAPVTMWENASEGRRIVRRDISGNYVEMSRKEYDGIPDDEKPQVYLTSDTLKFYTEKEPWCEIMIPFPEKSRKLFPAGMSDADIIKRLNELDPKALMGIGFRIPTQALNSTERFKIKGFLPSFIGNTVIVPSEITTKAGSDFDIDKLNMYLRSLYKDAQGNIQSYKLQGDELSTKEFYGNIYDAIEDEFYESLYEDEDNGEFISMFDSLKKKNKITREEYSNNAYKSALNNNYYDAIDDVLDLEGQFDRLTKANTDKVLKAIADKLNVLTGKDESLIPNRILDRNYLTNLRHAFLTGKKWVGISAVNTTGQSNTQKVLTLAPTSFKISLKHNSVDGRVSFSGVHDHTGKEFISDGLSEYTNAFVDVSKDPYALDIIYSDQLPGIFMMLCRAGVTLEDAALMMHQPVIKQFVKTADANKEYITSLMFNDVFINSILSIFPTTEAALIKSKDNIDTSGLEDIISNYASKSLDDDQNAQQYLILQEFFGYIKAASGLFELTQSTNYDTTRFRSGDELRRKQLKGDNQDKSKRDKFTIGNAEEILAATHIGELKENLNKADEALGAILKFNTSPFRSLINSIIDPYAGNQYLSADKLTRVSNKLTGSLLDYIVQTNKDLFISELTTGDNSIGVKYEEALAKFPDLQILQALEVVPGKTKEAPITIRLKVNTKDAFDENTYTDLMRGLRDDPDTADLYKALVKIAIVQGTYRTKVSIKNIIPIEDYVAAVSNIVRNAEVDNNVLNFQKNNWFQRNNYRDDAVVPKVVPMNYVNYNVTPTLNPYTGEETYQYSIPSAISYFEAEEGTIAQKMILGIKMNGKGSTNDLIVVPRIIKVKGGALVDYQNSKQITGKQYAKEAVKDVNKYDEVYGYQKVKYLDGTPVIMKRNAKASVEYVYKLVNLYGDGRYTSEYYKDTINASKLENGTVKPKEELTDQQIINHLGKMIISPIDEIETSEAASQPAVKEGVEISSNAKGLASALTNPTELAKSKGNLTESYPVIFRGKTYKDSEAAYQALKSTATKDDPGTLVEEVSIDGKTFKNNIDNLLKKSLAELKEANLAGNHFVLGFHGGQKFDKPDKSKQYSGEFRNLNAKRVAESMGARYDGQMLFYTEESRKFTYQQAIEQAGKYAIKYGNDNPSVYAYLIHKDNADFMDRGIGEVGLSYEDIENNKYREVGRTSFERKESKSFTTYDLMVDIIKAKLEQHPILISEITKQGGSPWILSSTHQPTGQNSMWETGGKNWFIKSLNDAYVSVNQSKVKETVPQSRVIQVEQFKITITPEGKMFYANGNELTDQTTKNKVSVKKELQDETLRVSVYNKANYFVLLDDRIVGSGKTNLGKESITDLKIKEAILAKAITYKETC